MACFLVLDSLHWLQYLLSSSTPETPLQKQILLHFVLTFSFHIRDSTLVMSIYCHQRAVPEWEITQLRATLCVTLHFSQEGENHDQS